MKTLASFILAAFVGFLFAVTPLVAPAEASAKYKATLTGLDGGSTNTTCFSTAGQTVRLVCDIPACYRTGTASVLGANCATDDVLIVPPVGVNIGAPATFLTANPEVALAGDTCIVVRAFDGGNPNCRVEQIFK